MIFIEANEPPVWRRSNTAIVFLVKPIEWPFEEITTMSESRNRFSKSFTDEVVAAIGRIDELIGSAHWASVGTYKEGVIRRQLVEYIPGRYTVGTGFVMFLDGVEPWRSRQIDILIWDSHNYVPIFRDGPFVIIPPQALRVAIEVKSTLTAAVLREALYNLDSLTQFIPLVVGTAPTDHQSQGGFLRFVVAANSKLKFPNDIFRYIYRYYLRCVYGTEEPDQFKRQWTMEERLGQTKFWGMVPLISGVAALGAGMVRAVRFGEKVGYVVSNDIIEDGQDQTIGMIKASIDLFLSTDVRRQGGRDYAMTGRERGGMVMPVPFSDSLPVDPPMKFFDMGAEPLAWTVEQAREAKAKKYNRKKMKDEAVDEDED